MSPEQVKGAPIDGRSDIFCLGTILYEITLGRRLWRGPREVAVKRIVEERPKPPTFVRQDYPAELEMIVLRSLEKKPEDRYQSATELHDDLQRFLVGTNAHLRNNFQMADYVAKIFSEEADALVSDAGRQRAQAFVDGSDAAEPDQSDLDFDTQQVGGPGAALARKLRASALGVWAQDGQDGKGAVDAPNGRGEGEPPPLFSESANDLEQAAAAEAAKQDVARLGQSNIKTEAAVEVRETAPGRTGEAIADQEVKASPKEGKVAQKSPRNGDPDRVPRRWGGVVLGIILAVGVVAGLLWWLSSG
jgi:hypothetical protein